MFRGSIPALVTPFRDEAFDEGAYRDFVAWQIAEGSHGLVPCGTTGEGATLDSAEHRRAIEACVELAAGKVPVIAGCGSNDTSHAIALTRAAKEAGADAALHVPPYYNRPNQEGVYAHLAAVAEAVDIPIVLYNVPSRTITDIAVETMARLAEDRQCRRGQGRDRQPRPRLRPAPRLRSGFIQLSGNDDMALGLQRDGRHGLHLGHRQCRAAALRRLPGMPALQAIGTAPSTCRTGSIRSTPPCSATPRRARSNMPLAASAPISPPTCACR